MFKRLRQLFWHIKLLVHFKFLELIATLKYRRYVSKALSECPDEKSEQRRKAEIEMKTKMWYAATYKKMHLRHMLTMSIIELVRSIQQLYDPEAQSSDEEKAEALETFEVAKDNALTHARWLSMDEENYLDDFIKQLESVEVNTYSTMDEWVNFINEMLETTSDPCS